MAQRPKEAQATPLLPAPSQLAHLLLEINIQHKAHNKLLRGFLSALVRILNHNTEKSLSSMLSISILVPTLQFLQQCGRQLLYS